jgi:hypothetical protein
MKTIVCLISAENHRVVSLLLRKKVENSLYPSIHEERGRPILARVVEGQP